MIYSVSLTYVSVFVPIPLCFDCSNFVVLSEVRESDTSSFITFSQIALAIMGLLWFHISFRIICSSSSEKCGAYFDRDCIKSIDCLWKYGHLKNINSSVQEHRKSIHFFVSYSVSIINILWFSQHKYPTTLLKLIPMYFIF